MFFLINNLLFLHLDKYFRYSRAMRFRFFLDQIIAIDLKEHVVTVRDG